MPHVGRRNWCRIASLGLSFALPALSARAAARRGRERETALIAIWLTGGPSQLESFDPHPGTPIGGPTRAIDTRLPGVRIAADYPRIADVLDRFTVIRSLTTREGDHERGVHCLRTGYRPDPLLDHPAIGAIVAAECPADALELPRFVALGDDPHPSRGGYLGAAFDPYRVSAPGRAGQNLVPHVAADRQARRLAAIGVLSRSFAEGREAAVRATLDDHTRRQALALMDSEQLAAFTIADESEAVRAAYGDDAFGRGCLVARRLVETGVRSVEVTLAGFDTHADNFSGQSDRATRLDPALAALVRDLEARDLLASTALVVVGEFGRTPAINPLDGRDHWPHGFSGLVCGAGFARGRVVGATDPTGEKRRPSDPIDVADLAATALAAVGVDGTRERSTPIGRPMKLAAGRVVPRLLDDPV